jgi:hypothetical protein
VSAEGGAAVDRAPREGPYLALDLPPRFVFQLMGASVRTIDRHYGHLSHEPEQAIRARLNAKRNRSGVIVATGDEGDEGSHHADPLEIPAWALLGSNQ